MIATLGYADGPAINDPIICVDDAITDDVVVDVAVTNDDDDDNSDGYGILGRIGDPIVNSAKNPNADITNTAPNDPTMNLSRNTRLFTCDVVRFAANCKNIPMNVTSIPKRNINVVKTPCIKFLE